MKQATINLQPGQLSEAALVASRQVWLASLGAAVVTRDWVQTEAGGVFKTLVKEGTAVESRAIRFVGDQIESSVTRANSAWRRTRRTVESTVKQAAEQAVTLAQQVIPRSLPKLDMPNTTKKFEAVKRAKKVARARKARAAKATKRTVKPAKRAVKKA
jgi:hypothetical protein